MMNDISLRSECEDPLPGMFDPEGESPESFRRILVDETDEDDGWRGAPFNPNLIDIGSQTQSLSNIVAQIEENEIDLAPAFQRSANLWDPVRQSRLIESLLLRIPLPAFYFDVEDVEDNALGIRRSIWHVIDGLQRLCAIKNFVARASDGRECLRLQNLEFLHNLEGLAFADLARPYQRIINETQLTVYLVKSRTPLNVKFNIFKRVNTGGMPLTQQEIRHALNQGVAADFLRDLAESREFIEATSHRVRSNRMLDREFVNRFLAFYLIDRQDDEDMDAYYCRALSVVSKQTSSQLAEIKRAFLESLKTIHHLFGKWAFCKLDRYPKTKPINKVLFEVMTVSIAKGGDSVRQTLMKVEPEQALKEYVKVLSDGAELLDLVSVHTGNSARVRQRYETAKKFLLKLAEEAR